MTARIQLDVHPFTDRGQREYQEDFFYTDPPPREGTPWLGALADGMGGHFGGDLASKAGIHALKTAFEAAVAGRLGAPEALVEAVNRGHEAVLAAAQQANAVGNMGSTIVAFAIDGPMLYWSSAGDSRLYLCRDNRLLQLSRDFTLAEDMRQGAIKGAWSASDIAASPQRNALTSFMGTDNWRHDDGRIPLQHGDVVVACSDGVYGTIDTDGIVGACRAAGGARTAEQVAQDMLQRVREVGKPNQDNSTAVVVRYVAPAIQAAKPPRRPKRKARALLAGAGLGTLAASVLAIVALTTDRGWLRAGFGHAVPGVVAPPPVVDAPRVVQAPAPVVPGQPVAASGVVDEDKWGKEADRLVQDHAAKRLSASEVPGAVRDLRNRIKEAGDTESRDVSHRLDALLAATNAPAVAEKKTHPGASTPAKKNLRTPPRVTPPPPPSTPTPHIVEPPPPAPADPANLGATVRAPVPVPVTAAARPPLPASASSLPSTAPPSTAADGRSAPAARDGIGERAGGG